MLRRSCWCVPKSLLLASLLVANPTFSEIAIDIIKKPAGGEGAGTDESKKPTADGESGKRRKPDVALFKNKDSIHGEMLSFSPSKGLIWRSPESLSDIIFKPDNLREIKFGDFTDFGKSARDSVSLTNGDVVFGKIISLDADKLVIDTPFAGELTIGRHMLDTVTPGSGSGAKLYSGPNSIKEWKTTNQGGGSENSPTVIDGVLTLNRYTAVSRDMRLPAVFKISFKFNNMGSSQFCVRFLASSGDVNNRKSFYQLYVSRNYFYLQKCFNNSTRNLGSVRLRNFRNGKGELTILCDSKKKIIIMLLDGKVRKQWADPQFASGGKFVSFYNQSSGVVKITGIELARWDGRIPGEKSESAAEKDTIEFVNDDKVTGKLEKMDAEFAVFATDYAPLKVPVGRIKIITFAGKSRGRARRNKADVRCVYAQGGCLTVNVKSIADGKIIGESENFGKAVLDLKAFKKVRLNIYDDK